MKIRKTILAASVVTAVSLMAPNAIIQASAAGINAINQNSSVQDVASFLKGLYKNPGSGSLSSQDLASMLGVYNQYKISPGILIAATKDAFGSTQAAGQVAGALLGAGVDQNSVIAGAVVAGVNPTTLPSATVVGPANGKGDTKGNGNAANAPGFTGTTPSGITIGPGGGGKHGSPS
jgi:hypothetical protein